MRAVVLAAGAALALSSPGPGDRARAQDAASASAAPAALARGDSLIAAFQTALAVQAFRTGLAAAPDDVTLLWKTSLALSSLAEETPGREGDEARLRKALDLARHAVREGPRVSRAHTALAIALGRYGHHLAHAYRIQKAHEVIALGRQSYAAVERARALDPSDFAPHVVLGVFHRELATVHPIVKAVARTFMGGYPDVSLEESVALLQRAVELAPESVTARCQLALTYRAMQREADARRAYREALSLEPRNRLEAIELDRAREYLAASASDPER